MHGQIYFTLASETDTSKTKRDRCNFFVFFKANDRYF